MVKGLRGIQNNYYGEVAPALLVSHQKCSLNFPKLEPIIEEASDVYFVGHYPKRVLYLVPVLLSFISYFLLYGQVI